jgi:hypothetical protein
MGIGLTQQATRNFLLSGHLYTISGRMEVSKGTEMLPNGKSSEDNILGIPYKVCNRR